jgi:iron complex outermembrane recepter protein
MRHPLTPLAVASLICLGTASAGAQTTATPPVETIVIRASADASAGGLSKAYPGGQVARGGRVGLLGTQDMMDTPFSGTSFTAELLQDQQSRSVADVLLNDPAVRNARGFGNFQELYVIRGFPVFSDDMAYNGLYGLLPRQYVAAELLERVEVTRGATAFLNGAAPGGSSLGGAINLMPKRATNGPLNQVSMGVESGGQAMLGLDLSRRFGADRATGLRVNAVTRRGDTAIDGEARRLGVLALGLDWHSGGLRLSADLGHQDQKQDAPRPSVTPLAAVPDAPDASISYAQPWTYANERQTFGTLRGELDLAPGAVVWVAGGARHGTESNSLALTSTAADGVASAYRFDNAREDHVATAELGVRGQFATGPLKHEISLSAATFAADFRNAYAFSDFGGFVTNLYQPVAVTAPPANFFTGGSLQAPLTTQEVRTRSVAVADTVQLLGDALRITVGARRQTIDDRSFNYDSGAQETAYGKTRTTPMLGVLWKFGPAASVYANYIEGLIRGDLAPLSAGSRTVSNGGQALAPYQTQQTELGFKFDLGRIGGSAALFSITKPVGALENVDASTAVFVARDNQRHRGVELSVFGEAAPGLKVLGGLSWIDAKLLDSDTQAVGVPRQQLNLGVEWSPSALPDLALNARLMHTGRQWADAANTHEVPAWRRVDIGLRWGTEVARVPVTLRARVDNLFDKAYWASAGGYPGANYLVLGSPRTYSVSASVDF